MAKKPEKPNGHIVRRGAARCIEYAIDANNRMHAKEFYDALPREEQAKFNALFLVVAEHGERKLKKNKLGPEWDEFWAFKSQANDKQMMRIACIRFNSRWFLLHGFFKPAQSTWPTWANSQCEVITREHFERWDQELIQDKKKL